MRCNSALQGLHTLRQRRRDKRVILKFTDSAVVLWDTFPGRYIDMLKYNMFKVKH